MGTAGARWAARPVRCVALALLSCFVALLLAAEVAVGRAARGDWLVALFVLTGAVLNGLHCARYALKALDEVRRL
jgi:hypothetical protein